MACILIIDDDVRICRLMARTLVGAGNVVIEAYDGDEGLRLFRDRYPDIVITDILLPKRDGISTIRELRREAPAVAIMKGRSHRAEFVQQLVAKSKVFNL